MSREYTEEQREANRERVKKWARANPERARARQRRWRQNNREKAREQARASYARNRDTRRALSTARRAADPNRRAYERWNWILRKYGLTREQWLELFMSQGERCACCGSQDPGTSRGWHTEHDHTTLKIRGITCAHCNRMLGAARDSDPLSGTCSMRRIRRPIPGSVWVFYSNDYSGGELVTFAESAVNRVGFSDMGAALNSGADVHSLLGSSMLGITYEDFVDRLKVKKDKQAKAFRQAAKPANFGFPGGMGAPRLVLQQRASGPDTEWADGPSMVSDGKGGFVPGYKGLRFCVLVGGARRCGETKVIEWKERPIPPTCKVCIEVAEGLRAKWFQTWREARPYLDWHSANVDGNGGEVVQHYSGRIRGGLAFCDAANGDFQALLADIAGRALIRVTYEQYVDRSSILYGNSRGIVFAHDELLGECRSEVGHEVSMRVNEIMVEEFQRGCPHHRAACKASPTLMRRWYKSAEERWDDSGRLICWEPR